MYAQVVVLTYQSPEIDSYTYLVPKELEKEIKIGQLIEVPFGKRNPQGIVIEIHDKKPQVPTKPISKILIEKPLLLLYQIELIKWMKDYYLAPMVNCLDAMLPEIPKRALRPPTNLRPTTELKARPWAGQSASKRPGLFPSLSLILVPSINKIAETLAKFPKAKNYVVYHNELKASEKFTTWIKIQSGEADYIFGSRSAIFVPCPNLKEIIIYDEHDGAYKDERSPYYDTLTIAQKISELTGAQIKIVDPSPKITTYFQLPKNIKIQTFPPKTKTVSMTNERLGGNNSAISTEIFSYLEQTKNALLFLNKKKEAGHLFCKSCKNSQYLEKQPTVCPACQSQDIFWNVLNIQSLATEVKKTLPRFAINLVSDKNKIPSSITGQPSIDIATAQIFYTPLAKKYDFIAHVQTDSVIGRMDFTSTQNLYTQITMLKKLLTENGRLFLQTYNQDSPVINFAANSDYKSFYNQELAQRKLLSYPPYSLLVKLSIKGKNRDKIQKEAEQLAANLQSSLNNKSSTTTHQPITILGPYESIFWQKIPTYHIILKINLDSYRLETRQKAVSDLKNLIGTLPRTWQVEVEPNSIQ